MPRRYPLAVLGLLTAVGLPGALVALAQQSAGGAPDLWQVLVGASPLYAPAIILGMLGRRILVFGWYFDEQRDRAARDAAEAEARYRESIQAERDRTTAANERAASWERISWEWATTGQTAVGEAVALQRALPPRRQPRAGG